MDLGATPQRQAELATKIDKVLDLPSSDSVLNLARTLAEAGLKNELKILKSGLAHVAAAEKLQNCIDSWCAQINVISIHQPDFFPWIGFFHKAYAADTFCLLDDAIWNKNSFYRRTYIRHASKERQYLVIPVKKHSDAENQINITIADPDWHQQHRRIITNVYRDAAFFKENWPFVEAVYDGVRGLDRVNNINRHIILEILNWLSVKTPVVSASQLAISTTKNQRNIDIIRKLRGTAYYSGSAAKAYNDHALYERENISIFYEEIFDYVECAARRDARPFINGLSILDWIFCYGKDATIEVLAGASDIVRRRKDGCLPTIGRTRKISMPGVQS